MIKKKSHDCELLLNRAIIINTFCCIFCHYSIAIDHKYVPNHNG